MIAAARRPIAISGKSSSSGTYWRLWMITPWARHVCSKMFLIFIVDETDGGSDKVQGLVNLARTVFV